MDFQALPNRNRWLSAAFLFVLIGSDQITKLLAMKMLVPSVELAFLHNLLNFYLVDNHGGFLGIVDSLPQYLQSLLLEGCVALLLAACLLYLFGNKNRGARYRLPLLFITGGGLSNLLDRFIHDGGVIDFVSIGVGNFRTGIFNLADVYILFGSFVVGHLFFSTPNNTPSYR